MSTPTDVAHRLPASMDPFRPENLDDPYPFYARLRSLGGCTYLPDRNVWFVSTYASVSEVLRNYRQFVSGLGSSYHRVETSGFRFPFIDNDPPEHTRIRREVQRHFNKSSMGQLRPIVATNVRDLAVRALEDDTVDVVQAFSKPLPDRTIAAVTGIQAPDSDTMARWADAVFHVVGPEPTAEQLASCLDSLQWLADTGLDAMPAHCLGRTMMDHGGDTGQLAKEGTERLYALASIWLAGVDTTNSLISNLINAFALHPTQWDAVRADRSLIPSAVEEGLRWDSPVRVFMRRTTEEVELQGVTVPANADICAIFPSANRDPGAFERPDEFDVTIRRGKQHLAFGASIHLCLGAPVARLEAVELLEYLADHVVRFEHVGEPVRGVSRVVRNFSSLPMRFVTG